MKPTFCALAMLSATFFLPSCLVDKAYDLDKLDKEITVFEDRVSLPVGNLGPLDLKFLLPDALSVLISDGDDGYLTISHNENIFTRSVYEAEPFPSESGETTYILSSGAKTVSTGIAASAFGALGFRFPDQKVSFTFTNPLEYLIDFRTTVKAQCRDRHADDTYLAEWPVDMYLYSTPIETTLGPYSLPDDELDAIRKVSLDTLIFQLPANWREKLPQDAPSDIVGEMHYTSHISFAGSNASLDSLKLRKVHLGIGAYEFRHCSASFTMENTLPINFLIRKIDFLMPDPADSSLLIVDPNITVTPNILLKGGSLDDPGVTPVTLEIRAKEGTIPDINGLQLSLSLENRSLDDEPLSLRQGLTFKDATISFFGGITLNKK